MSQFVITDFLKNQLQDGELLGRIARTASDIFTVWGEKERYQATVSGKFRYEATEWPVIGDWVVYEPYDVKQAMIHRVLDRSTVLSRKEPGSKHKRQVMAANIDGAMVVTALTSEFNLQRLERYVLQVYESGARPIIVCTKRDLCANVGGIVSQIENHIPAVPVYAVSSLHELGMDSLLTELQAGKTFSLIGSSGVGKSTLINRLLEKEMQVTKDVREQDGKGRHTTTHREMFILENGAVVIDTPGMRELQLWGDSSSVEEVFSDIDLLADECKFRDCKHHQEPGCAVLEAISKGELTSERLKNYNKLSRELYRLELKEKYGIHRTNRILHSPNSN
ncbi:ribosome small subunit-dependent GTPase A [Halobacillus seohaensis]|uniref:Small ribosomal subunit biogenesis GTPase RsgA n=1 Tax=Halobacillus seohaensis TaxID=447421 RepID=A0ABW2EKI9_9BACI